MSLSQMEQAVALLVRLPNHNRGPHLEGFLARFDLLESEKMRLRRLATDPDLKSFGETIQRRRIQSAIERLPLTKRYLGEAETGDLLLRYFEPRFPSVKNYAYPLRFLEFLLQDEELRGRLSETVAPYVWDALKIELTQLQFEMDEVPPQETSSPAVLNPRYRIVWLKYDVFQEDPVPPSREFAMIFVNVPEGPRCRMREIDSDLAKILESKRTHLSEKTKQRLARFGLMKQIHPLPV